MGPVNWLAVVVAAALAFVLNVLWYGPLMRSSRQRTLAENSIGASIATAFLLLLSAIMLGHNFARIGTETLAVKPWLYLMQTGGVAIFFVIPAVWLSQARVRIEPARRVFDSLFWLVAYLVMGVVFWVLSYV